MNCTSCKLGTLKSGFATVTFNKNGSVIVFKNVPAQVCDTCQDFVVDEQTARELLKLTAEEASRGSEVSVINYKAAA
jgi:YgiT-type zinc finger domain-containing protein